MISPSQKLNQKIFDRDVEQVPIRKGEFWGGTQSARPEADVPRRGRGIFQQKNICDLVKNNAFQIPC